jgi:rod shape determining protein RodA
MILIDRRLIEEIDWVLLGLVMLLSLVGVLFIYSSSHFLSGGYYVRQLVWIGLSLLALFIVLAVDYKFFVALAGYLYILVVALLAATLVFAKLVAGTKSWISLGLMQLQPSELAKIAMILALARFFAEDKREFLTTRRTLAALLMAGLPFLLIVAQPDLGTAMTFLAVVLGAFILAGLRRKAVVGLVLAALVLGVGGWNVVLKDYQKRRVTTLINPAGDPRGSGYQVIQSKIAIGSGGLTGRGFKKGTQSSSDSCPRATPTSSSPSSARRPASSACWRSSPSISPSWPGCSCRCPRPAIGPGSTSSLWRPSSSPSSSWSTS